MTDTPQTPLIERLRAMSDSCTHDVETSELLLEAADTLEARDTEIAKAKEIMSSAELFDQGDRAKPVPDTIVERARMMATILAAEMDYQKEVEATLATRAQERDRWEGMWKAINRTQQILGLGMIELGKSCGYSDDADDPEYRSMFGAIRAELAKVAALTAELAQAKSRYDALVEAQTSECSDKVSCAATMTALHARAESAEQARDAAQKAMSYVSEQAHLEWTRAEAAESALHTDTERLRAAERRVYGDDTTFGCDAAEHLADIITELRVALRTAQQERSAIGGALIDAGTIQVGPDLAVSVRALIAERDAARQERDAAQRQTQLTLMAEAQAVRQWADKCARDAADAYQRGKADALREAQEPRHCTCGRSVDDVLYNGHDDACAVFACQRRGPAMTPLPPALRAALATAEAEGRRKGLQEAQSAVVTLYKGVRFRPRTDVLKMLRCLISGEPTMDTAKLVTLPAGTVVHVQGLPFTLAAPTEVEGTEENLALVRQLLPEEPRS